MGDGCYREASPLGTELKEPSLQTERAREVHRCRHENRTRFTALIVRVLELVWLMAIHASMHLNASIYIVYSQSSFM